MPCQHLQELYAVAEKHDLKIAAHDAVHIVCNQCDEHDTCPSALTDGDAVVKPETKAPRRSSALDVVSDS